jgi:hypothetical protein
LQRNQRDAPMALQYLDLPIRAVPMWL